MKRLAAIGATACIVLNVTPAAGQISSGSLNSAINGLMSSVATDTTPGCAVGVSREGNVLFTGGYGLASMEFGVSISPQTVFPVASMSKQFTAMAILLLVGDGKLTLEDDVRAYIPELPDYGQVITIRQLLDHTSGLRDHWELLRIARGRLFENRVTQQDALEMVFRQPELNHVPGADWLYSATGYTLAAEIVERVSGQPFQEFTRRRIFEPLGMADTRFQYDYTMVVPDRANSYYRLGGRWRWMIPNSEVMGPTGLLSTVNDLLKWERNYAHPVVGDHALISEMSKSGTTTAGERTGYGLGLFIEEHRGEPFINHGGDDAAFHAASGHFPNQDLVVTVICNANSADATGLQLKIADLFLRNGIREDRETAAPPTHVTQPGSAGYVGIYAGPDGTPIYISQRGDSLILGGSTGPVLVPLTENRFVRSDGRTEYEFIAADTVIAHRPSYPFTIVYTRQTPAMVDQTKMQIYAGEYYSSDVGGTYEIIAQDSTLILKTRWGRDRTLRPTYGDYFSGPIDHVTFTRDSEGAINGFLMNNVRLRNLKFRKVD